MRKDIDGYIINRTKQIGRGAFATVYECTKEGIEMPLCVKEIKLTTNDNYDKEALQREIRILINLMNTKHSNIIKVLDIFESKDQTVCFIFMEKCCQGHIEKLIKTKIQCCQLFTAQQIIEMVTQIIQGYSVLYKSSIIHRDLKPENLLLGNDGKIKISDFGLGKILEKETRNQLIIQSQVGTPYYASPQILNDGKYSSKTDIFSLGVITYYLIYLQLPFERRNLSELIKQQEYLLKGKDMIFPSMKIQGEKQEKDKLLLFLSKTITYYEENRIDWPGIFKMFLSPEEYIQSTALIQQNFESTEPIEIASSLLNDNTGLKRTYESYQSYQVRMLIHNLMAREELAKQVQQNLFCLNKYNQIFGNQVKNILKVSLCGYQMAINLNQIYLISNQYDQICKQIKQVFQENTININCEFYLKDKYEKVEQQKAEVENNSKKNQQQFKESIQMVLQGSDEFKDEDFKKFKILLQKGEYQPNFEIYSHWYKYFYNKYVLSKMQKYLELAQEQETLMFFALSKKFIGLEKEFPIKDFFTLDPLYIQYMNSETDYLKQYIRSNAQQQQMIDQNRNDK
ncbi:unnamed protein product [Paramecium sonneborni]|uniref:Protein kinase domain-containing protein n=1 Tax=Paramecium sonneborni TaxID=65129 RepID=A0A8S1MQU2_9CILI|nr:unnamed protein product [Paramecium sonneborni]